MPRPAAARTRHPFLMRFDTNDITAVIPHRPPFLLIDAIHEVEFRKRGVGVRRIGPGDDFIDAYLPPEGIMPRTLLIEALAQTAAFVAAGEKLLPGADGRDYPTVGYLVRIADVVFSGDVRQGDTIRLFVDLVSSLGSIYKFAGVVRVGETEICRGNLTFSVA
jgi:3-hydroxyacyl-[acyl-carrier-protein] dehydratase